MLTYEEVSELLEYRPEIGGSCLVWKKDVGNGKIKAGSAAGYTQKNGYVYVKIKRKLYRSHRLVWLLVTKNWPKDQLDHIDGVKTNNVIGNLRECNSHTNQQNRVKKYNSVTGYIGVAYDKERNKYLATIGYNGKRYNLGRFSTPEEAHVAYLEAKSKFHTFNPVPRA